MCIIGNQKTKEAKHKVIHNHKQLVCFILNVKNTHFEKNHKMGDQRNAKLNKR